MGPEHFSISLNNCVNGTYTPGQTIEGRVNLVLNEPMKMRGLRVRIKGNAHTKWTESSGGTTELHVDTESYINQVITLWGKERGEIPGENPVMSKGSYEFSFTCVIPPNCPPSFEGRYGHIRYSCEAYIDIPWAFDYERLAPFQVVGILDLNQISIVPIQDSQMKQFGCWCCTTGNVACVIEIPRNGFVPGEYIQLHIEVHNKSRIEIKQIIVTLMKTVHYRNRTRRENRYEMDTVLSLSDGPIASSCFLLWSGGNILVPFLPISIISCPIISLAYELRISIVPEGCHSSLSMKYPIFIGSEPLLNPFEVEESDEPSIY